MQASVFFVLGLALSLGVASPVSALPTLTSALSNWGRVSLFGPEMTRVLRSRQIIIPTTPYGARPAAW